MINGEIVFIVADVKPLDVDFGERMMPTKIVNKGDVVVLGKRAPKNKWMHKITYNSESEYLAGLEEMMCQLCSNAEYVNELVKTYEEVNIMINVRSEYAELGYTIPNHILKKMSLLDCSLDFNVLSFGMATDAFS